MTSASQGWTLPEIMPVTSNNIQGNKDEPNSLFSLENAKIRVLKNLSCDVFIN